MTERPITSRNRIIDRNTDRCRGRLLPFYVVAVLLLLSCGSCSKEKSTASSGPSKNSTTKEDSAAIQKAFNDYRAAIGKSDGSKALTLVSTATFEEFERIRKLALTGKPDEIQALPIVRRTLVLTCRSKVPNDRLQTLDGKALYALSVDQEWTNKNLPKTELAEISISDGKAIAVALVNGKPFTYVDNFGINNSKNYVFVKEDDKWKLDLPALMRTMESFLSHANRKPQSKKKAAAPVETSDMSPKKDSGNSP